MLKAIGKYIDTMPLMRLFSQEERFADTVTIEVDRYHDGHDLAHFRFMMRGITESGGETETPLLIAVASEEVLQLKWEVAPEFTLEGGTLSLDLFAYQYEDGTDPETEPPDVLVRYQLPDVFVRPLRDHDHTLEEHSYTAFLLEVRRTAENAIAEIEHMVEEGILPELLENRIEAAEAAITQLRSTLASHTDSIAAILSRLTAAETALTQHGTRLTTLESDVSTLQTATAAQGTRLTALENSFIPIVILTQAEYDAIVTPDPGTLYVIRDGMT